MIYTVNQIRVSQVPCPERKKASNTIAINNINILLGVSISMTYSNNIFFCCKPGLKLFSNAKQEQSWNSYSTKWLVLRHVPPFHFLQQAEITHVIKVIHVVGFFGYSREALQFQMVIAWPEICFSLLLSFFAFPFLQQVAITHVIEVKHDLAFLVYSREALHV